MNYRDFFKKEAITAKLKDIPKLSNVDPKELEMGIKVEKEHSTDESTARTIAMHHLAEDPKYYTHMKSAGIKEEGLSDGGLPKRDGALDIPHLGQPIHMAKIINVGSIGADKPASGELSGYTNVVSEPGDKEKIIAAGKSDPVVATKSVGGPVVPGEGQKQGGPNTKGRIADTPTNPKIENSQERGIGPGAAIHRAGDIGGTPKNAEIAGGCAGSPPAEDVVIDLMESKKAHKILQELISECMNELCTESSVKFINEGKHKPGCKCAFCKNKGTFGKKAKDKKSDGKKSDDKKEKFNFGDKKNKKEKKIDESTWERRNPDQPSFDPLGAVSGKGGGRWSKGLPVPGQPPYKAKCKFCGKEFEPSSGEYNRCPDCLASQHQSAEHDLGVQEASYKVVSPTQARCSKCDHARTVQTDPQVTEQSYKTQGPSARVFKDSPQFPDAVHDPEIAEEGYETPGEAAGEYIHEMVRQAVSSAIQNASPRNSIGDIAATAEAVIEDQLGGRGPSWDVYFDMVCDRLGVENSVDPDAPVGRLLRKFQQTLKEEVTLKEVIKSIVREVLKKK